MKKTKVMSAKRSLVMSVLSLILCFAMLIGTTYAWFTDSVTSGKNKIVAGNLDVELWHTSKSVTTPEKITDGSENLLFKDVELWEPGAYAYETFKVKNVGNLALKYRMALNVASYTSYNGHNLTEVLKVKVVDIAPTSRPSYTDGVALEEWSLDSANQPLYPVGNVPNGVTGADSEKTFTVVIYWQPTDNDNLYNMNNGRPQPLSVDLGVQLVATQFEYESDSFDNTYDHNENNTLPTVTKEEYQLFANMSGTVTEDLKVEKQGIFEEATVPKEIANSIFNEMKKEGTNEEDIVENNLTVFLNVEETTKTVAETTANYSYDIDMTAVMESIVNDEKTTEKKTLNNLEDFVEIKLAIEPGFSTVNVKHNDNAMTSVTGKNEIPTTEQNPNGYYNYDAATGILTLWTKSFSPFTVDAQHEFTYTSNNNGTHNGKCQTVGCTKTVTNEGCTIENGVCTKCGYELTYYVDATNGNDTDPATVGDKTPVYQTLEKAMSQAQTNNVKKVVLLSDVSINRTNLSGKTNIIDINQNITLDLNSKTLASDLKGMVSGSDYGGALSLFKVANGTFTLNDTGNNGHINLTIHQPDNMPSNSWPAMCAKGSGVYLAANNTHFVMNGGNITFTWEHTSPNYDSAYFVCGIDKTSSNNNAYTGTSVTVNGGSIVVNNNHAGKTGNTTAYAIWTGGIITVNGGTLGNSAQNDVYAINSAVGSTVQITGGVFNSVINVYQGSITGGTFNKNVAPVGNYGTAGTLTVTGGTFNGTFQVPNNVYTWPIKVSGGTFVSNPKNCNKVSIVSDYKLQQNGTSYRVVESLVGNDDGWTDAQ